MHAPNYSEAAYVARDYYDTEDTDNFYHKVWGGEDLHIGVYRHGNETIFDASRQTVELMASRISELNENVRVLDLGAGYAGSARFLAHEYGCRVVALNLSCLQNRRAREMNRAQGLDHLVEVIEASYEEIPFSDLTFDVVWSQEALLHSERREKVLEEANRVLKPGGEFIFTDPMQADGCPKEILGPILERVNLSNLASPSFYRREAERLGMTEVGFDDHTQSFSTHFSRVLQETEDRKQELSKSISNDFIERQKVGLKHWADGGNAGHLSWGIFHFRKNRAK